MRSSLAILCTFATLFSSGNGASACCLTDWLFGRNQPVYAVGYAPVAMGAIPVDAGPQLAIGPQVTSAPASSVPVFTAAAPVATGPEIVGIPPVTAARPVVLMPAPTPVSQNGVYQAQRPAYIDNPSVYTGQPVYRGQPAYPGGAVYTSGTAAYAGSQPIYSSTPVTGNVQATYQVAPANPYLPPTSRATGNPLPYRGQVPVTSYRPQVGTTLPGAPLTVTTPTGLPATALPPTQVTPLFPPTPPQPPRGLRGLFSRWFGTGYQTSYYSAPVTYYRPVTAVDPVSGGAVIVQQPCTSTEQQVQRTPFTTFQSPPPAYSPPAYGPAPCATSPSACPTPVYSQPMSASGIGQVGAVGAMGQGATSIPSTLPSGAYGQAGGYGSNGGYNMTPLQGAPPALPPTIQSTGPSTGATGNSTGDLAPIERPQLNSGQSSGLAIPPPPNSTGAGSSAIGQGGAVNGSTNGTTNGSENGAGTGNPNGSGSSSGDASGAAPSNYWELQNADDSTAMIRPRSSYSMTSDPQSLGGRVEPIAAPEDYSSPFRGRSGPASSIPSIPPPPVESKQFEAPPLPARSPIGPTELTSVSTRAPVTVSVRKPATPRRNKPRDSTWYPVNP